jgi:tRNA-specific 2-thiouridylase
MSIDHKQKIFVGMSGGVDSAVSAKLLQLAGFDVTGVYMKNWSGDDFGIQTDCPWEKDIEDVAKTCEVIGIPFKSYNFEKEYREKVVEYFFKEYRLGRTPNPDIMCNSKIKFKVFLERIFSEGSEYMATGHYARNQYTFTYSENGTFLTNLNSNLSVELFRGIDKNKDQSYFLSGLTEYQLQKVIFPIGGFTKPQVRELAQKFGLPVANKKDSQGICFIGDIDVREFLRANIHYNKGVIVDADSDQIIGEHDGVAFYTIGQREGLSGVKVSSPYQKPYFVSGKNIDKNILYVVQGSSNPKLFSSSIDITDINLIGISFSELLNTSNLEVAIRYRQKSVPCTISKTSDNTWNIEFSTPQKGVSSGQSAVFYIGEKCIGRGVII